MKKEITHKHCWEMTDPHRCVTCCTFENGQMCYEPWKTPNKAEKVCKHYDSCKDCSEKLGKELSTPLRHPYGAGGTA